MVWPAGRSRVCLDTVLLLSQRFLQIPMDYTSHAVARWQTVILIGGAAGEDENHSIISSESAYQPRQVMSPDRANFRLLLKSLSGKIMLDCIVFSA